MDTNETVDRGISHKAQFLLEKCRELELANYELYTMFAETYSNSAEAVYLWRKTASEELNHAEQFTLALKLRKGMHLNADVNIEKAESAIQNINATITSLKSSPINLIEALAFAIRLEKFLAELHLSCIAVFNDDSFRKLFNAMMSSDQEHTASIEALHRKLTA